MTILFGEVATYRTAALLKKASATDFTLEILINFSEKTSFRTLWMRDCTNFQNTVYWDICFFVGAFGSLQEF